MSNYETVIPAVQTLLAEHPEWVDRYAGYMETIAAKSADGAFARAQAQFSVPAAFELYMPLSTAVNDCSSRRTVFELRFHGQSTATLSVDNNLKKTVSLRVKKAPGICRALRAAKKAKDAEALEALAANGPYDWTSEQAKQFRRIYAALEKKLQPNGPVLLSGQPEHDMESALLQNLAKKTSKGKEVPFVQPVTMAVTRARFQMPTPLCASSIKKGVDTLRYAGKSGGGIDILARMGSGRTAKLAVMELKDENTAAEPPQAALCQAVAYAVFLRELLRSPSGQAWWQFFGFGGTVPKKLTLRALAVMPLTGRDGVTEPHTTELIRALSAAKDRRLAIPGTDDQIELGYIFRDGENPPKTSF